MQNSVVIVDDNPDDAMLIKRAVLSLRPKLPIRTVFSGMETMEYLDGEGDFADREAHPYPALIFLDLRMPEINGYELLKWLKNEPRHSKIPVIVVTCLEGQAEIKRSYELGARTFLRKPVTGEAIRQAIQALKLPIEFFD